MPNILSAKKAMRVSGRKRILNDRRRIALKKAVKEVRATAGTDKKEAQKMLATAYQAIDKAMKRGIIKKNTASRKKANLAKLLKK